jgi:aspartate/methionine/tyrosine aminotransferase
LSEARRTQLDQPAATRPLGIRPAIEALPASKIGEVAAVGFGDPAVVPLWFGESDLPTPSFIGDAAVAALRDGQTFYTHKRGIPALRQAIAEYLTRLHEKPVGAERVAVTSAGMSAIMLACQILVEPGDNVVIVSPVWPNINASVEALGGEARAVPLTPTPEGGWRLDVERVRCPHSGDLRQLAVEPDGLDVEPRRGGGAACLYPPPRHLADVGRGL